MNSNSILILLTALIAGFALLVSADSSQCELINAHTGRLQKLDCLLDPEATEGPYYLPLNITRSAITEGKAGLPLNLTFVIMNSVTCQPIPNAIFDIWHADAFGKYSGIQSEGTSGQTFLRGVQVSNSAGQVTFQTIYPGWYPSRCVHIHIEVFVGGSLKHTGQLFFSNAMTTLSRTVSPYSTRTDSHMTNEQDGIYNNSNGASTTFTGLTGNTSSGYSAVMYVGVNPGNSTSTGSTSSTTTTTVKPASSTTTTRRPSGGRPSGGSRPRF